MKANGHGLLLRSAGDIPLTLDVPHHDRDRTAGHLDAYLPPGAHGTALPGYRFTVHTDAATTRTTLAAWAREAQRTVTPVPGLLLTESTHAAGRRRYTLLRDTLENRPGDWAVQIHGTAIDLHTNGPAHAPRYLLRLIREVMLRSYENQGGIVFHAAGAVLPQGAVMICGPGSAGKTTTLAALLKSAGGRGRLLSNDRLIAQERGVVAVPLPVRLARGTLHAFPELHAACHPEQVRALPSEFGTTSKVALPARTFAGVFGSRLAASGHLRALIIPRLKDNAHLPYAERLSSGEAHQALRQACFTPLDEFWSPWLVPRTRSEAALAALAEAACARLAAQLPCHRITAGIHAPAGALTETLTALTGDW